MKSVSHRSLFVVLVCGLAARAAAGADTPEKTPAARALLEPAEPLVPDPIRTLLEGHKYAESAQAIDQAAGEKGADHEWLAYLKGRALYLATKYDDAVTAYRQAEEKFPESRWRRRYRFGRALALARKGDFQAAEQIYRDEAEYLLSADRKRQIADVYLEFANRYFKPADEQQSPDYQKALEFYNKALESLGTSAQEQARVEQGDQARLAAAENGDPAPRSKEEIELRMARCYQELGNLQEAANRYAQFTKDHPTSELDLEARYRLGEAQLALEQKEEARRTWQDLLAAYGDNKSQRIAEAMLKLSETYSLPEPSSDEELDLGVASLEAFLKKFPEQKLAGQAHLRIARAYAHRGRYDDAVKAIRRFLDDERHAKREELADARVLLGRWYQRQKKFDAALEAWREYLAKHPAHSSWSDVQQAIIDTEFLKGAEAAKAKRYDEARKLWQEFLAKYPLDHRAARVLLEFGRMKFLEEQYDAAIAEWRRVVAKYPNTDESSQAQYLAALTLEEKLGKLEEALKEYKKVTWGSYAAKAQQRLARLTAKEMTVATERVFRTNETPRIKLTTRNIESVTVRAYSVDLETYFRKMHLASGVEGLDIALIDPDKTFELAVPKYAQYQQLASEIEIPLDDILADGVLAKGQPPVEGRPAGVLAVTVSSKTLEATTLVMQSDLDIVVKSSRDEVFVFAENMRTGKPWPAARLLISNGQQVFAEGETREDGVFQKSFEELKSAGDVRVFAIAEGSVASNAIGLEGVGVSTGLTARGYIYTDRPAYRAGQLVHVRGVVRNVADDRFTIDEGKTFHFEVFDSRNRLLRQDDVTLGKFGTFHVHFGLPQASAVGDYRIQVYDDAGQSYQGGFRVHEYRLEPVRLAVDSERKVFYRGEEIAGKITAKFYYGAPLADREIRYQLAGGRVYTGTTNEKGELEFKLPTRDYRESQTLPLVVTLAERNLQTSANFYLATQGFSIGLSTVRNVFVSGETFEVSVNTRDAEGKPIAEKLTLNVLKRAVVEGKVGEVEVEEHEVATDKDGKARITLRLDDGGQYVLRAEGTDRFKNPVSGTSLVRVSDDSDRVRLRILADRHTYKVGDKAVVKLHWRDAPALALVTFQGGKILDYQLVRLQTGANELAIPMTAALAPNFDLAVAIMTDGRTKLPLPPGEGRGEGGGKQGEDGDKLPLPLPPGEGRGEGGGKQGEGGDKLLLPLPPGEGRGEGGGKQGEGGDKGNGESNEKAERPHPNPLPEGEGTELPPRRFHEASSPFAVERDLHVAIATKPQDGDAAVPGGDVEVTLTATDPQGKPVEAELSLAMIEQALWEMFGSNVSPIADFFRSQPRASAMRTASSVTFAYHPATRTIDPQLLAEKDRREVEAMEEERRTQFADGGGLLRGGRGLPEEESRREAMEEIEASVDSELRRSEELVNDADNDYDGSALNGFLDTDLYSSTLDSPYENSLAERAAGDRNFDSFPRPTVGRDAGLPSYEIGLNSVERAGDNDGIAIRFSDAAKWNALVKRHKHYSGAALTQSVSAHDRGEMSTEKAPSMPSHGWAYFATPDADTLSKMNSNPVVLLADGTQQNWQAGLNFSVPDGKKLKEAVEKLAAAGAVILPPQGSQETAYWSPAIVTDKDGQATVTITLPERTTAWKLLAKGVTGETLAGEAESELVVKKDLFGELKLPLAFTDGDQAEIQTTIHNDAIEKGTIEVTLKTTIGGKTVEEKKTIEAGKGMKELPFKVELHLPLPPGEGRGEGGGKQEKGGEKKNGESNNKAKRPHPNPLPEGEGTDDGESINKAKRPHPNPLPEGEGTDDGESNNKAKRPHPDPLPEGEGTDDGESNNKATRPHPNPLPEGEGTDDGESNGKAKRPHPNPLPEGEGTKQPSALPEGEGTVEIELTVAAGERRDVVRRTVPIRPYGMPVFAAASGSATSDTTAFVESPAEMTLESPTLEVLIGPNVEQSLLDALLAPAPLCQMETFRLASGIETATSDLMAALGLERLLGTTRQAGTPQAQALDARIRSSLSLLVSSQNDDGGWNWARGAAGSNRYTASRAVWALSLAKAAGYKVADEVFEKAIGYLQGQIAATAETDYDSKAVLLAALASAGRGDFTLANRLYRNRPSLSTGALVYLALALAEMDRAPLAHDLFELIAKHKFDGAPEGTRLRQSLAWSDSAAELRAIYLLALEKAEPESAKNQEQADWLLAHRIGHRWSPDKATGPAVLALAGWFAKTRFDAEHYQLTLVVNGFEVTKLDVTPESKTQTVAIPAGLLKKDKQRIQFQLAGRGQYTYQCLLSGFVPADKLKSTTTDWTVKRFYEPAPRELDGQTIPRGFDVLQGAFTAFRNTLTQLPVGQRGHVEIRVGRNNLPANIAPEKLDYLVVTERLPAGVTVIEQSIQGAQGRYELTPGEITFFLGGQSGIVSFDVHGYLPGEWRAGPTTVRNAYRPEQLAVADVRELSVLPLGAPSQDEYRLSPRELFEFGKRYFERHDWQAAAKHLTDLVDHWQLQPKFYQESARMLLDVYLELGVDAEIVRWFELIKEKWPDVELSFEKIVRVGAAYDKLGEYERSFLVFRATIEGSFARESGVAGFLEGQGEFLRSVAVMGRLLAEYPPEAYAAAAQYALAQRVYAYAPQAAGDQKLREKKLTRVDLIEHALSMLDGFLTAYPEDPAADQASFSLANALVELKAYRRAVERCGRFAERYPKSDYLDSFWYIIGYSHFALGEHEQALEMCRKVAEAKHTDRQTGREEESRNKWQAIYILAQVYNSLGRAADAIQEYTRVAERFADARRAIEYFTRKAIELPEVSTFEPGKKVEVELKFRNVAACDARVYRIDLMKFSLLKRNLSHITNINLAGIRPYHEATIELGDGKDYRDRTRNLSLPLKEEGAYLVVCRGDSLHTSGLVLVTPLVVEVQEEASSGEVRTTVKDLTKDRYQNEAHVKVIGSGNAEFISGETDLRGVFVAGGVQGTATVIAEQGDNRYAFFRGRTWLGPPEISRAANTPEAAKAEAPPAPPVSDSEQLLRGLQESNSMIQQMQSDNLKKNFYENQKSGVQLKEAF